MPRFRTTARHTGAAADPDGAEPVGRRGALGLLGKGGMVMVAGLAGVFATSTEAAARDVYCCHLSDKPNCPLGCPNSYSVCCPSGYYRRSWTCMSGTRYIVCYECTKGGNCYTGPFVCSRAIDQT
ncbi:hypothetical protein ACXZ65_01785 [Streptomyces aculeolatus]|jgi:hypothetical protein